MKLFGPVVTEKKEPEDGSINEKIAKCWCPLKLFAVTKELKGLGKVYKELLRYSVYEILLDDSYDEGWKWCFKMFCIAFCVLANFAYIFSQWFMSGSDPDDAVSRAMRMGVCMQALYSFVRLVIFQVQRERVKGSVLIDFIGCEANTHRPAKALGKLAEDVKLIVKINRLTQIFIVVNMFNWYFTPVLCSRQFWLLVSGGDVTLDEFTKSFPTSVPGNVENVPNRGLRYMAESTYCLTFLLTYGTVDGILCAVVFLVRDQFQILKESVEPLEDPGDSGDDPRPLSMPGFVRDHQRLIKCCRDLEKLMSPVIGFQLLVAMLNIGGISLILTTPSTDKVPTDIGPMVTYYMKFFGYLTLSLLELYIFCWLTHVVNNAMEEVSLGVYRQELFLQDRHWLLPMCQRQIVFKAIGMVPIDMSTFLSVVKLSYSYVTLMQNTNTRDTK